MALTYKKYYEFESHVTLWQLTNSWECLFPSLWSPRLSCRIAKENGLDVMQKNGLIDSFYLVAAFSTALLHSLASSGTVFYFG